MSALVMRMIGDSRRPATPPSLSSHVSPASPSRPRLSGLVSPPLRPKYKSVRYRKAAFAVPTARQGGSVQKSGLCRTNSQAGRFGTGKRPLPYQTARQGGSVQESGLCRTKPHGGEVRYRKAASAVPNRTAGQNLRRICGNLFFAAYYVEVFLINLHPRKAGT